MGLTGKRAIVTAGAAGMTLADIITVLSSDRSASISGQSIGVCDNTDILR